MIGKTKPLLALKRPAADRVWGSEKTVKGKGTCLDDAKGGKCN
jgi:hypothetical protein